MGLLGMFKKPKAKREPKAELPAEVKRVVDILRRVRDPETELNIVDEGLVYGLTVEGSRAEVFLMLARSTPKCHFCQSIAINIQNRILRDVVDALKAEGFNTVKVYNELGLLLTEG
jgi:metal-sulfur cluster biosynthetic enzyme